MNLRSAVDAQACGRCLRTPSGPRRAVWVLMALVVILLLTACGGSAPDASVGEVSQAETPKPPAVALVTPTQAVTAITPDTPTAVPTATDTPEPPTPTLPPATDTPEPVSPTVTPTESATEEANQATAEEGQPAEAPAGEEGQAYELPFLGPPDAPVTIVEFGEYL